MDRLKGKRNAFCRWYLALGNPREAALRAGCAPDTAADDGLEMLHSPYCRRVIGRMVQQTALPMQALVTAGLIRLAFGDANDAVRLAFTDEVSDEMLRTLDLFHVTSIKRDKNGVEVKLADRLAAMQMLSECAGAADQNAAAAALLHALQGGNDAEEVNRLADCDAGSDCAVFAEAAAGAELVAYQKLPEA